MNAPFLWIFLPLGLGALALSISRQRTLSIIGGASATILSLLALIIPIDQAMSIGTASFKLAGTVSILGRSLTLQPAHGALLAILYGLAAMWFFGAQTLGLARRLVPAGLAILALLVAAIAVRPFLFASVFIEIAVLLSVPMLVLPFQKPGRGILRYVAFQTIAVPLILFAGWLLSGVETSPGDIELTAAATSTLALGLAFLLAIFPLYTWIPMLAEESHPYLVGFLLWVLPQTTALFAIGFLDRYPFLRLSADLMNLLRDAGLLMVVTAGLWAAFQRHLGRLMAYAVVVETGLLLITLGLGTAEGVQLAFMQIIPRGLGLIVWALSLSVIQARAASLRFVDAQGAARALPIASAGIVLAHLSAAGLPLLAGFPIRMALLEGLARESLVPAFWLLAGLLGLMAGAVRTLAVIVLPSDKWGQKETYFQAILIGLGILALFTLGLFPQAANSLTNALPALFQNLGQ